jgi:hypothetical protein
MHRKYLRFSPLVLLLIVVRSMPAQVTAYAGVIGGVSTLSADGGSKPTASGLNLSSYAPENGGALNLFVGADLHDYVSIQGNFIWNRNSLHLNSASPQTGTFYQEDRSSTQEAGIFDVLLYFRNRASRIRPYLGTGVGILHFSSSQDRLVAFGGAPALPPPQFSSIGPVFRSHVGIDIRIKPRLSFRYSFSEMISHNPISSELSPPGPRHLANFQNLFGFVTRF